MSGAFSFYERRYEMNAYEWVLAMQADGNDAANLASKVNKRIGRSIALYGALIVLGLYKVISGVHSHGINYSTIRGAQNFNKCADEYIDWETA